MHRPDRLLHYLRPSSARHNSPLRLILSSEHHLFPLPLRNSCNFNLLLMLLLLLILQLLDGRLRRRCGRCRSRHWTLRFQELRWGRLSTTGTEIPLGRRQPDIKRAIVLHHDLVIVVIAAIWPVLADAIWSSPIFVLIAIDDGLIATTSAFLFVVLTAHALATCGPWIAWGVMAPLARHQHLRRQDLLWNYHNRLLLMMISRRCHQSD